MPETFAEKIFKIVKKITEKNAIGRAAVSEMVGLTPAQTSWALHDLNKHGKISKTDSYPHLWYQKTQHKPKEPEFTEIIEDHIINCPARGYNGKVLLSECNYNPEHPDCLTCEEGLKCQR